MIEDGELKFEVWEFRLNGVRMKEQGYPYTFVMGEREELFLNSWRGCTLGSDVTLHLVGVFVIV